MVGSIVKGLGRLWRVRDSPVGMVGPRYTATKQWWVGLGGFEKMLWRDADRTLSQPWALAYPGGFHLGLEVS